MSADERQRARDRAADAVALREQVVVAEEKLTQAFSPDPRTVHGTHVCYRAGCRCRLCVKYNHDKGRPYRERRKLRGQ